MMRTNLPWALGLVLSGVIACGGSVAGSDTDDKTPAGASGGGATSSSSSSSSSSSGATGNGKGENCDGYPDCSESETKVAPGEKCPAGATCRTATACGVTVTCASNETCAAAPVCPPNTFDQKGACPQDVDCYDVTACGVTIHCSSVCNDPEPPPACNPGDRPVKSMNECPQDASCYLRTGGCGVAIWCTGP